MHRKGSEIKAYLNLDQDSIHEIDGEDDRTLDQSSSIPCRKRPLPTIEQLDVDGRSSVMSGSNADGTFVFQAN